MLHHRIILKTAIIEKEEDWGQVEYTVRLMLGAGKFSRLKFICASSSGALGLMEPARFFNH